MAHKSKLVYTWGEVVPEGETLGSLISGRIGNAFHELCPSLVNTTPFLPNTAFITFDGGTDGLGFTFSFTTSGNTFYINKAFMYYNHESQEAICSLGSKSAYLENIYVDIVELQGLGVLLGVSVGDTSNPPNWTSDCIFGGFVDSNITLAGSGGDCYIRENNINSIVNVGGTGIKKQAVTSDAIQLIKSYSLTTNTFIDKVLLTTVGKNPTAQYCIELAKVGNKYYYIWNASSQTTNVPQVALECTDKITA